MTVQKTFEDELLEMIQQTDSDIRKAEQKLITIQGLIDDLKKKRISYKTTLDDYRERYGLTRLNTTTISEEEVAPYRNVSTKDMVRIWAEHHGGEVVMRDACDFLARAGLFRDSRQAAGALYTACKRAGFPKDAVRKGVFKLPVEENQRQHNHAHVDASLHPAHKRLLEEGGELGLRRGAALHVVQFRQEAPDAEDDAGHRGGCN